MPERVTAEAQLSRILRLLPLAAREEGIALAELAAQLETDEASVLKDLQEVYTRTFYHAPGSGEGVQILIEPKSVAVWTTGEFRRPTRLAAKEAMALGMGLRVLAAESAPPDQERLVRLAERLEQHLASEPPEALLPRYAARTGAEASAGIRDVLTEAARRRRRCRVAYLKPSAPEPDLRVVEPYVLLIAGGRWYLIGHCCRNEGVRVFRLDRILDAEPLEETFSMPDDFRPEAFVREGRVYRAEDETDVVVRYSARIARWIREKGPVEEAEGGCVLVRHRVADPGWVVRLVLQYAADAEVLSPPEVREQMRQQIASVIRRHVDH